MQCPLEERVARRNELKIALMAAFVSVNEPDFPKNLVTEKERDGLDENQITAEGLEKHDLGITQVVQQIKKWCSFEDTIDIVTDAMAAFQKEAGINHVPLPITTYLDKVWTEFRDALEIKGSFSHLIPEPNDETQESLPLE